MIRKLLTSVAVGLLLVAAGCKGVPDGVLTEKELAAVMVDLQYADALVREGSMRGTMDSDSLSSVLLQSILKRHGVTQAEYDSTLRWYGHNMVRYVDACEIADSIIADSIRAMDRLIAQNRSNRGGGADTVDVWPNAPIHVFSPEANSDYLTFSLESEKDWRKGDVYILEMTPINAKSPLTVKMVANYSDARETTEAVEMPTAPTDDKFTLTFQMDSDKVARRIYGYIYLPTADGERVFLNNISLKRTRLDSEEYYRNRHFQRQFYQAPRFRRQ